MRDRTDPTERLRLRRALPRRRFLAMSGMGVAGAVLFVACGEDEEPPAATPQATPEETPESTPTPTLTPVAEDSPAEPDGGQVLIADVSDHRLTSNDWTGDYGWVRFQLHQGFVEGMTVTFKLHKCYPNTRYIVTDATLMAEMMHIAPAPGAEPLTEAGATAKIYVFGNGVEGSGPMGAQKSVTDTVAGDPRWSSFWDHFTFVWDDAAQPEVLRSEDEILDAEERGDLERFNGTPDTHPTLFMVNCPVPVVADVD